jgi:hypothetical protein
LAPGKRIQATTAADSAAPVLNAFPGKNKIRETTTTHPEMCVGVLFVHVGSINAVLIKANLFYEKNTPCPSLM